MHSKALINFEHSICDASELLAMFDSAQKPPTHNTEVLKRASLVMALTAWETYVEDRVREEFKIRIRVVEGSYVGKFVASRLEDELKRFHNPTAAKTRKLFLDYLEVDVAEGWNWEHFDSARAQKTLDELIAKRGDPVHRSRVSVITPTPFPHLIKRDELEKAIRFLKCLVRATDAQPSHE